jgi:hypothetical protein
MGYNARLAPRGARTTEFASVATDGSSLNVLFSPSLSGQVLAARFINGPTATVASGTTAGSALNVYVYKTASNTAASAVASAALGAVGTLATATLTMSTSTALTRFTDGAVYCAELIGGAGNNNSNAGAKVELFFEYAHAADDDATPG